jgi:hypothetical protein
MQGMADAAGLARGEEEGGREEEGALITTGRSLWGVFSAEEGALGREAAGLAQDGGLDLGQCQWVAGAAVNDRQRRSERGCRA